MKNRSFAIVSVLLFSISIHADENRWDDPQISYSGNQEITVYRSPACGCCHRWIEHLEKHDFIVKDIQIEDVTPIKYQAGVPPQLASCHTAVIDGYFIEGHVPADDIKRLLLSRPDVRGLSVPEMPVGTPGMEMENRKDDFAVIQLNTDGSTGIFSQYSDY